MQIKLLLLHLRLEKKSQKKKKKLCLVTKERPSTPVLPQKNGAINSIPNIFFIGKEKKKKKKSLKSLIFNAERIWTFFF